MNTSSHVHINGTDKKGAKSNKCKPNEKVLKRVDPMFHIEKVEGDRKLRTSLQ